MQIIKVEGGVMPVGQGTNVLMSKAQFAARRHNIEASEPVGDVLLCKPKELLHFKSGEIIGLDEVPKGLVNVQRDATPDDGADAVALLAAAETLKPVEPEQGDGDAGVKRDGADGAVGTTQIRQPARQGRKVFDPRG